MSYLKRSGGPNGWRHDPAATGIFIHGGTSLMHGRGESLGTAQPNYFTISWPSLAHGQKFAMASSYPACTTFQQAVKLAEKVRDEHPVIHHCPILACTDLIKDKPWCGKYQVQLVSHRLAKAVSVEHQHPKLKAA